MLESKPDTGGLAGFLRENWLWIVGPIAVLIVVLAVLAYVSGQDETSPFIYNVG